MAVNVEIGVDIASFTSGIKQGQSILKGLNAEMKASEAEFKATGNAEKKMESQTKTLNSQLQVQKGIAAQAEAALKRMTDAGIKPTDAAYQKMYAQMMNARAGMNEAQAALNNLGSGAQQAAAGAENLSGSLQGISKKMSLEQVIGGIDKITSGLENAAKKAIHLGEEIFNSIMNSAQWADDTATQAMLLDLSIEDYQRYKTVFDTIGELTIADWMKTKRKVEKAIVDPTNDQIDVLRALGFVREVDTPYGPTEINELEGSWEDVFWKAAEALKQKVASGELTLEQADVFGEAFFGKGFSQLKPLIDLGKEGFVAAFNDVNVASSDAVEANAELNDKVTELKASFNALEQEVTAEIAPALTEAANALNSVLGSVLEYLKTPEGKAMLESMGSAITELFSGLQGVKAEDVVSGFKTAFDAVTGALQWIVDNKDGVMTALEAVFGLWGTFKVAEGVLTVAKVIEGITGLSSGAAAMGEAAGASWGSGFAGAVMKAAPWLIGLYTLLNPSGGTDEIGNSTVYDENGNLTGEGQTVISQEIAQLDQFLTKIHAINLKLNALEITGNTNLTDSQVKGLQHYWTSYTNWRRGSNTEYTRSQMQEASEWLISLFGENNPQLAAYRKKMASLFESGYTKGELDTTFFNIDENGVEVPVNLQAPVNAAADLAEQIGDVPVKVQLMFTNLLFPFMGSHANGLPFVQNDGLAYLHKGERVLTASQNRNYTYNSNNYFGNVNLNNGQDIEALCDTIDRRNRRRSVGYGA